MDRVVTSEKLHSRLRLLEVVVFLSLALNVVNGYVAMHNAHQVNQIEHQTGVQP